MIGDIVGSPGRDVVKRCVPMMREQYGVHACIANGENAAGGFGLTASTAEELFSNGIDFITSGNHIFDKREFISYLGTTERVIRPANYPPGVPGKGYGFLDVSTGSSTVTVGVLNLMGRTFMPPVDDPFRAADTLVETIRERTPVIILDLHAEASSEKVGMARFLDGRVSAIYGTHTHIQTADEHIMPGGTAYISDLGLTGPSEGVIGMEAKAVLERFTTGISEKLQVQKTGPKQFCAAVVTIECETGHATNVKRIFQRNLP